MSAGGVDIEHKNTHLRCFFSGPGDRIRDIVEFKIQKNGTVVFLQQLDNLSSRLCEELIPHLEDFYPVFELENQISCPVKVIRIQCQDNALFIVHQNLFPFLVSFGRQFWRA